MKELLNKKLAAVILLFTASFLDALKLGKSMKCQWKKDEANFGTALIKGKNYKSENTIDGKTSFIIHKDNCTYIWTKGEGQGIKMCRQEEESQAEQQEEKEPTKEEVGQINQDWQKEFNYKCSAAIVADSQFNPPAEVEFKDIFNLVPKMTAMPSMPALPGN